MRGRVIRRTMLTGRSDERWGHYLVAWHPSAGPVLARVRNPDHQRAVIYRQIAAQDSRFSVSPSWPEAETSLAEHGASHRCKRVPGRPTGVTGGRGVAHPPVRVSQLRGP